jgi:8-oxo-dGTP pyrophosphatase MutT (NUDIX family)
MEDAAKRETFEEAGVTGKVEVSILKSISYSISFVIFCQLFFLIQLFGFNFPEEIGHVVV